MAARFSVDVGYSMSSCKDSSVQGVGKSNILIRDAEATVAQRAISAS